MTSHESLILRYIGQNSTKGDDSDISLWEFDKAFEKTWGQVMQSYTNLKKEGLITGSSGKNGSLNLTDKGWEVFEKEMETPSDIRGTGIQFNVVSSVETKEEPKKVTRARKPAVMVSFNGAAPVEYNSTKTKQFRDAGDITIYGELSKGNMNWMLDNFKDKTEFKSLDDLETQTTEE